ncbi:FHA domain-containing protein [Microbacterium hominis]|uniref:FHA domain-containing protein n=1 Tax=Microbacterium hominis TaxID=162426 RepID=A0A7D4U388_9MICO|nr:FHA domain-containing protein [Microbacterium hominis]
MLALPTGTEVDLSADVVYLGRRPSPNAAFPQAQLVEIHDGTVSKTHARLERRDDGWAIADLDSTNGTVLVGADGAEREIEPGEIVAVTERFFVGDAVVRLTRADDGR